LRKRTTAQISKLGQLDQFDQFAHTSQFGQSVLVSAWR